MDVIATHINADFDCLGSMIAAKRLYPEAQLVFPGGQERGLRDFLLQSTLYAYDIKRVRDIDLSRISRLILVDVRSSQRIGPLAEVALRPDIEVHIYDHHPADDATLRGSCERIELVGATVTILTEIFVEKGLKPTPEEATMMMLGLYEDTGYLLFPGTTPADFRAAAFLLEHGANLNTVADFLVREMTPGQVELLNALLKSCRTEVINGVEVALAHASTEEHVGDISSLVHKLREIENLDVLVVAVRMEDRIFLVGRSRLPEVHVGELLQELGGGGHATAASATVRDKTLVQLLNDLETLLPQHVRSKVVARDLMSIPVKTLDRDATISDARDLMGRFNFNALPVLDAQQQVVGIITRQVVEKAIHHRLSRMAVGEIMNSDFQAVAPEASLSDLRRGIIEHNQRCIPVLERGVLVGVVTRTDLLRHLLGEEAGDAEEAEPPPQRRSLQLRRKNLRRLLEAQLPDYLKALLEQLGAVADRNGLRAYLVGGFVRDLLLRQSNLDIDVVIEGDGIAFARAFAATVPCRIREHEAFSTAVIIFPDGFKVDVASARLEYYERPAALPNVEYASIRHDLYRRDFTINTLTLSLNQDSFGQMLDFYGGLRDLKEKSIRVLHNLSFIEDPTRMFRAVRFEQRLGFRIGRQTERLMRSAVRMKLVKKVGGARILNELMQILDEPRVVPALQRLEQFELLSLIDRRLRFDDERRGLLIAAERACSWFDLLYTGEEYRRWLVYLLCLFDRVAEKSGARLGEWLGLAPKDLVLFSEQRIRARRLLKTFRSLSRHAEPVRNSDLYHWFRGLATEVILYLMARSDNEQVRQWISLYMTDLRRCRVQLSGRDLIALGLTPGRSFQEIFSVLLDARLNGEIRSRAGEIALVKDRFLSAR